MDFYKYLNGTPQRDYIFQQESYENQVKRAAELIKEADTYLIGIGAGMSTAAGLYYGGERFRKNFGDFIQKYGSSYMTDMYHAGFYPYPTEEARWGYWARQSYLNRIEPEGTPLYQKLYDLVKEKEYFILSTNVDSQPEKSGFAPDHIFATQGNYAEIQCMKGCHKKVYNSIEMFTQMVQAEKNCLIPSTMVPKCPVCGGPMTMHLRVDEYFVEDQDWNEAAGRYETFLQEHADKKVALIELGVGFNTPTIIRFPFEQMLDQHKNWAMIRLNLDEAVISEHQTERAVGINEDIAKSLVDIESMVNKE